MPENADQMSSVPLMTLRERQAGGGSQEAEVEAEWSDQELEEFSRDPLENVLMQMRLWPKSLSRQQCVRSALFLCALSLCIGCVSGYLLFLSLYPPCSTYNMLTAESQRSVGDDIVHAISFDHIQAHLLELSQNHPVAEMEADAKVVKYIMSQWQAHGLDHVRLVPYRSLLSYPNNSSNGNRVSVVEHGSNGRIIWSSQSADNEKTRSIPIAILADIVYANYGRERDFLMLRRKPLNVNVSGRIVLMRFGRTYPADKVRLAEQFGAIGVILYPDPAQFSTSIQRGFAVFPSHGDPFYPSIDNAFRIPVDEEERIPRIPVMSISSNDARTIIGMMGGEDAPAQWTGCLNTTTYKLGPTLGQSSWKVKLEVHTNEVEVKVSSVIGMIRGRLEPDRYVLLGSHHNPGTASAALLELTRVFGKQLKKGWRPRRTLLFCSWGGEELARIGSTKWTEEFAKVLTDRAVAYLNVDGAVRGNYSFEASASPILYEAVHAAVKKVRNPDPSEVKMGRITVYDTWLSKFPSEKNASLPVMVSPGTMSDHSSFAHVLGVPIADLRYTYDPRPLANPSCPLYHAVNDGFNAVDTGFKFHVAVAQAWAELTLALVDRLLLPLDVMTYARSLRAALSEIKMQNSSVLEAYSVPMGFFETSIGNFSKAAKHFHKTLKNLDRKNPLSVRAANDQLMQLERAFIVPSGLSCQPLVRHIVYSPNNGVGSTFPCLRALLYEAAAGSQDEQMRERIEKELAISTFHVLSAAAVLSTDI